MVDAIGYDEPHDVGERACGGVLLDESLQHREAVARLLEPVG